MRLPSVQFVGEELLRTVRRFPAAVMAALGACAVAWHMAGMSGSRDGWDKLLLSLALGLALFYALALMNERPVLPRAFRPAYVLLAGLAFVVLFFADLLNKSGIAYKDWYAHWLFIVLFFVTFSPYLAADEDNGFWQFNKRLFVRSVISSFYTVVLFAGISLAVAAVDKLLGVEVDEKVYQYLWIFAWSVFWPLHLMGGTPRDPKELEEDRVYPKGLKLFTQYILIPLATVYFLILYAYMAKILFTQQWPQGWVSWLTSSASVLGLVTFLLLYPVQDLAENRWIKLYARGFCMAAIPLLIMLFTAVYKRAEQYGLTEHRCFLIVLAAWLLGIFLYFIFSRKPKIRLVPVSLVIVAIFVSFGPWGVYSVSLSSQLARLEGMLLKDGLLVNGKAVKFERELGWEERKQLSGCLDYVVRSRGVAPLKKYFTQDLDALSEKNKAGRRYPADTARELMAYMGQTYLEQWAHRGMNYASVSSDLNNMDVRGFDLAVKFSTNYERCNESDPKDAYSVVLDSATQKLKVFKGRLFKIEVPLKPVCVGISGLDSTSRSETVPQNLMSAAAENKFVKVKAYFQRLSGERKDNGEMSLSYGEGLLLVKEKAGGGLSVRVTDWGGKGGR